MELVPVPEQMFRLKKETDFSLRNVCVLIKNMMMDNVKMHNNCINIPLSQSFMSYLFI
jgi:hypothetical protein